MIRKKSMMIPLQRAAQGGKRHGSYVIARPLAGLAKAHGAK